MVAVLALVTTTPASAFADPARDRQWHLAALDVAVVHKITRGAGVSVALIDTGVDAAHRDLAGAVLAGYNTRDSRWNDKTGRRDVNGHGTNMAGIIAGRGHGSGDGVLGIAPAAKILPITAPVDGFSSSSFLAEAVDFAIARKAGVINMSFGGAGDETMHDTIRKAQAADIVLVASAGNRGDPGIYPGQYPEVLTVGAYRKDGKIAKFSVTGPQVDLAAPGADIVTTSIGATGYDLTDGTSEAAAMVSGAAALVRAEHPDLSAAEVVHRLTATADDAGPRGRDDAYGHGRLNLLKALTADVVPPSAAPPPAGAAEVPPDVADGSDLPAAANPMILVGAGGALLIVVVILLLLVRGRARRAGSADV
ncbi:S8 family serine peptidase [Paractinoplanes rishiriensis]|uniref:S8 family serine peptidase n=1 Tax=Paractinoplanes rishiriensis TaxID=1050105 RepID=UPI0019405D33|nr:S8 family serine peptidase [Actinoplanes rishiriensis]